MNSFYWSWFVSALVLAVFIAWIGKKVKVPALDKPTIWGFLIDARSRYSLNRLQLMMWTFLIISTFLGLLFSSLFGKNPTSALAIPDQLLGLLGISTGSAVVASAVKNNKDVTRGDKIVRSTPPLQSGDAAPLNNHNKAIVPRFSQVFLEEEGGQGRDEIISVSKFQNFLFTLALGIVYVVLTVKTKGYPSLDNNVIWLIGISHSGYIGGKIPNKD